MRTTSGEKKNAINNMPENMNKFLSPIFVFAVFLLVSCASRREADILIGKWDVVSMTFPETTVGQAQQQLIDPIIPNLQYEFLADSTYLIYSDRLAQPTIGKWYRDEKMRVITKTNNGVVIALDCTTSDPNHYTCTNYNPEIGIITLELTRINP